MSDGSNPTQMKPSSLEQMMSVLPTSPNPIHMPYARRATPAERRMLQRQLIRRDWQRRIDTVAYRYRHTLQVAAVSGVVVSAMTVGHTLYLLLAR